MVIAQPPSPCSRTAATKPRSAGGTWGPDTEFTQAWVHDDLGNVTQLNYPRCVNGGCLSSGAGPFRPQKFLYRNGRMTNVSGFVDFIGYHPNGMIAHVSHNNGTTYRTDLAPDGMLRPSNIHLSLPGNGQLSFGNHRYDGAGNLIVRGPEYFLYDRASRITRFQRGDGTNQRYTYDTFGNMGSVTTFDGSSSQTRTFAINRQKNRLAGTSYDARGNMLQWATQDYRYDVLNNLQHKDFPWETYIYTADDERVLTMRYRPGGVGTADLDEIYTLRDLDGKVLRRYFTRGGSKGTWTWSSDYLHDGRGWVLVEIQNRPFPLRNKHYAHDHLGTPVVITGQDGAIFSTDSLWAYGEPVDPNQSFTVQRFTGHERDYSPDGRAFDLDYMHARYNVPHMGRFMSVDPASRSQNPNMPQSWNRYAYGLNSPMKYTDPDGEAVVLANSEKLTEANQKVRTFVKEKLEGIPLVGKATAFVADAMVSSIFPTRAEEVSLPGMPAVGMAAQAPGAAARVAGSRFVAQLERQLAKDGSNSVFKSLRSLEKRLAEHQAKLPGLEFKSSVEREIRTFEKQIEELLEFIELKGLKE